MKKCSKCKINKNESSYSKRKASKDGLSYICKECKCEIDKEYKDNNRDHIKNYMNNYYESNKELIKSKNSKKYHENKDTIKEVFKEYYIKNSENIKEKSNIYYYDNKKDILDKRKYEYNRNSEKYKEKTKKWSEENQEAVKKYRREYYLKNKSKSQELHLKNTYNLTIDDYNKIFDEQKGCCKICEKHQSEFKAKLAVDHCHQTGKIRGLLCNNCNRGLGHLKDSVLLLKKAIKYIKNNI